MKEIKRCLCIRIIFVWYGKSQGVNDKKDVKETKSVFKIVVTYRTKECVKSHFEYVTLLKKFNHIWLNLSYMI